MTWPPVTLASTLTGGAATTTSSDASSVETAAWNLLSTSVGHSLEPYLGKTLTEVQLSDASFPIGGYVCLEDGQQVVGIFAQPPSYSLEPMSDVSALGKTISQQTGQDFLGWRRG